MDDNLLLPNDLDASLWGDMEAGGMLDDVSLDIGTPPWESSDWLGLRNDAPPSAAAAPAAAVEEGQASPDSATDEQSQQATSDTPMSRGSGGPMRREKSSRVGHNAAERKRTDRINGAMQKLQALLQHGGVEARRGKANVLDSAVQFMEKLLRERGERSALCSPRRLPFAASFPSLQSRVSEPTVDYRAMFTHSAVPMVIVSIDSRILAANELFTTMVCMTQEEACERSVLSITHPEDVGRAFGTFIELLRTRNTTSARTVVKRCMLRDGVHTNMLAVKLFSDTRGRPQYFQVAVLPVINPSEPEDAVVRAATLACGGAECITHEQYIQRYPEAYRQRLQELATVDLGLVDDSVLAAGASAAAAGAAGAATTTSSQIPSRLANVPVLLPSMFTSLSQPAAAAPAVPRPALAPPGMLPPALPQQSTALMSDEAYTRAHAAVAAAARAAAEAAERRSHIPAVPVLPPVTQQLQQPLARPGTLLQASPITHTGMLPSTGWAAPRPAATSSTAATLSMPGTSFTFTFAPGCQPSVAADTAAHQMLWAAQAAMFQPPPATPLMATPQQVLVQQCAVAPPPSSGTAHPDLTMPFVSPTHVTARQQ